MLTGGTEKSLIELCDGSLKKGLMFLKFCDVLLKKSIDFFTQYLSV